MPDAIVSVRGGKLAYSDTGRGTPVVLLHAFPLDRGMWQPQIDALAGQCRILAVDLPGFGQSSVDSNVSVETAADGLAELLEAANLPGRVVLGGLSMGGYVAMAFARRHPQRLAGLILADTRSDADDDAGKKNRDRLISMTQEFGPSKVYEVMLPKVVCEDTLKHQPKIVESIRVLAARQSAAGVIGGLKLLRDRPDATPELSRIVIPTLIIVGELDAITPPPLAEQMASHIAGSRVVVIPGAGHLSNMEKPTAFNAAVGAFVTGIV